VKIVLGVFGGMVLLVALVLWVNPDSNQLSPWANAYVDCQTLSKQYVNYPSSFEILDGDERPSKDAFDRAGGAVVTVQFTVRNAFNMKVAGEAVCSVENGRIKGKPGIVMENGNHN